MNHIKFPCYTRNLYGESIGIHVLVFKWRSVSFDNLFRNMIFGPQLLFCSHKIVSHTCLWYKTSVKGYMEI